MLEVVNVTKRFGGIVALRNVSLKVERGERIAIVGPNGSGKTTLFNVINGVYPPEEGKVIFEGADITMLPSYKRAWLGIARAFQIPRPFPNITLRESVAIGALFGSLYGKIGAREALEIADERLKLVGLYDKRNELTGKLAVPELKLLEFAKALAMKPKLLLLDEIVAGMPPSAVDYIVSLVRKISDEENIAIATLVEHVMRAVVKFAERVIVLHLGSKVLEGRPEEVLRNPLMEEIYLGKRWSL
ncbi:MAG: ABC transporter ATP-binding protein [Thermoprotei archaeon]|nr:ABC transporter ATP-binding protein [Thermoprotei archaeon]